MKKRTKSKKLKAAAVLTVRDAGNMTAQGRRAIAAWLRRNARFLEEHGKDWDKDFVARYLYS